MFRQADPRIRSQGTRGAPRPSMSSPIPTDNDIAGLCASVQKLRVGYDEAEVIDWEKEVKELDLIFDEQANDKLKLLPRMDMPSQFRKELVLPQYQKDGIRWLVTQEREPPQSPLYYEKELKDGSIHYYSRVNHNKLIDKPTPLGGSILADEMGLGKTLMTLGLMLKNPGGCTLVVCPKSVIANWDQQIKEHLKPETFRVAIYAGPKRASLVPEINKNMFDVVLACYDTITADMNKRGKLNDYTGQPNLTIFDTSYYRVVLDEAHVARNSSTKTFRSVSAIQSEKKLCLTGTPILNHPDDIYSLLAFLKVAPLACKTHFQEAITQPILDKKRIGLKRLRMAMAYVTLRRMKKNTNIDLPPLEIQLRKVHFVDGPHKNVYDSLYNTTKAIFEGALKVEAEGDMQMFLFEQLLRLRQACCHGSLVPSGRAENTWLLFARMETEGPAFFRTDEGKAALSSLSEIGDTANSGNAVDFGLSPKMCALLDAMAEMKIEEKGVIFSQFTSFLDIIQKALKADGHKFVRIDGTMSTEQRIAAMSAFNDKNDVRFILCSIRAAGTGISLTRGNVVFMMDPWFNSAVEDQAMQRVHRMGQVRPVRCLRFVMKGSLEERLIQVQKSKAALGKASLERISRKEERMAKITAMKDLFEIVDDEEEEYDFLDDWEDF